MTQQEGEPSIGFVGLGKMGAPMAGHVLKSGRRVIGWDRSREAVDAFVVMGGSPAQDLAALAPASVVVSIVYDDEATREITLGPGGLVESLEPGALHVVMATISPALSRELAEAHTARGQSYLAASVFGQPAAASAAQLLINCSGTEAAFERAAPILNAMGSLQWVGPEPEQAMLVKVMGNNMIFAAVEILHEMFQLLETGGIVPADAKRFLADKILPGSILSGYAERRLENPKATDLGGLIGKDNLLCLRAAEALGVETPLVRFLREQIFDKGRS